MQQAAGSFHLGDVFSLPNSQLTPPLNKPQHGLTLTVDTRWNDNAGYHPIRVKLHRIAASQSSTSVTMQFYHATNYRTFVNADKLPGFSVVQDIEIPGGVSDVEFTVHVPFISQYNGGTSWEVFVDGSLAEELSSGYPNFEYMQEMFGIPRFLFMQDPATMKTAQDLVWSSNPPLSEEEVDQLLAQGRTQYWGRSGSGEFNFLELPLAVFPTEARGYCNLDIIYVSRSQFQTLKQNEKIWKGVREWMAAGGSIWITGVDLDAGLTEIDEALDAPGKTAKAAGRGWQKLQSFEADQIEQNARRLIDEAESYIQNRNSSSNSSISATGKQPTPKIPEMLRRSFMLGEVRAFSDLRPFAPQEQLLGQNYVAERFSYTAMLEPRDSWQHRHGLSLHGGNTGFWNWLVPGVGLPPVSLFQILITLFVIIIGPVNYMLLRKLRRLHLLLATVPLAALLITGCIVAYSLFTDGLATRVRTRSYTEIDQTTGLGVAWARHSYYSGFAAHEELTLSKETIVYPIRPENYSYGSHEETENNFYEIQVGKDQHLLGDWVPSRVPTQYLTICSAQTKARLQVKQKGEAYEIHNKLQTPLTQLLVTGTNGKFYWGEKIGEGATVVLTEITKTKALGNLRASLQREVLTYPDELSHMNNIQYVPLIGMDLDNYPASSETSLLELAMTQISLGNDSTPSSPFAPGRFIAIVDRSPLVSSGLKEVLEEGSLNVITGRWK